MIFSSMEFLIFLVIFCLVFFRLSSARKRKYWVLLGSAVFYSFWSWKYLSVLWFTTWVAYYAGIRMEEALSKRAKKIILVGGIVYSLGLLAFFKYGRFVVEFVETLWSVSLPWSTSLVAPLGISFFSFQCISYLVDVYRGRIEACRNGLDFFVYKSFFPQLISGPIVRAKDFLPQILQWRLQRGDCVKGFRLFLFGFFQKAVLADSLAQGVDTVFARPSLYSSSTLTFSLVAYAAQIFYDFSGYSLMAMGLARMMSIRFPQNFSYPYLAISIQDFWRRWHMTLSSWLRDYLYIPLGGSRRGEWRTLVNLMVTMLLGGLWHGAGLNFIIWGSLHGLILVAYHVMPQRILRFCPVIVAWLVTQAFVLLAWIFFRCSDATTALVFLEKISLQWTSDGLHWWHSGSVMALCMMVAHHIWARWLMGRQGFFLAMRRRPEFLAVEVAFWILMILILSPTEAKPFIYFQF